jgi:hypothetical protein
MDPITQARQLWTQIPAKKTEQPQDDQDPDDNPQHEISPFPGLIAGFGQGLSVNFGQPLDIVIK